MCFDLFLVALCVAVPVHLCAIHVYPMLCTSVPNIILSIEVEHQIKCLTEFSTVVNVL
jgi:hypothetical protein